ncbi:sensor histidine kinase [Caldanaerobius polysaccharolyticus]|uniref:sensor histidine kinase n=1 Tax=Caldanaerobius polysaccharolyticus TaxID=44256 RepID=UPI00047BA3A5|nr:ATP-binding protein [Caldanaerobius polysaccharolyticus]
MKISFKIAFTYAILLCAVLITLSAFVLLGIRYYLIQQAISQVRSQADTVIKRVKYEHYKVALNDSDLFDTGLYNIGIIVYSSRGKVFYSSDNVSKDAHLIPFNKNINLISKTEVDEKHLVYLNKKIQVNKSTYYIQIIRNMDNEYDFIKALFVVMVLANGAGVLVSVFIGFMATKRVVRPIDYIIKKVKEISVTGLNTRLEIQGPEDEFTRLARTFNNMLDRIQDSFKKQERFVSDASHELRTPIAAIKGYVDMLDRWGKEDKEVLQESIDAIRGLVDDMSALTERLLFLAKSDNGIINLEKERFLLNDVIKGVAQHYRMLSKEHIIEVNCRDDIYIWADKNLIKEMLRAFIDNSIKYTQPGGKITLQALAKDDKVKIEIRDTGIGIPEKDIPFIFERFYRVDKSRSKEHKGWGLGLSIAKRIIDSHDGSINVESKVGEGTTFVIDLPNIIPN